MKDPKFQQSWNSTKKLKEEEAEVLYQTIRSVTYGITTASSISECEISSPSSSAGATCQEKGKQKTGECKIKEMINRDSLNIVSNKSQARVHDNLEWCHTHELPSINGAW